MNQLQTMFDGNPADKLKAITYLRKLKRATLRSRLAFKVEDGVLYHGYTSDVERSMKSAALRREMNKTQTFREIQPLAAFDKAAVRSYARSKGISSVEMYRNPVHLKAMVKDPDYAKFRLQENAHKLVD